MTSGNTAKWPQRISVSRWGMVSTQHSEATLAGREMLADGVNAVDAAVAAAFAPGVCEPQASGLGGQTMMLMHIPAIHKTLAIDGSFRAPSRFRDDLIPFLKKRGLTIKEKEPYAFYMGCIQMVINTDKSGVVGVADPRRDGSAAGPQKKPVTQNQNQKMAQDTPEAE